MLPYTNRARNLESQKNFFELNRSCTYDLQSVVVHVGGLDSGKSINLNTRSKSLTKTGHYVSYHRVQGQVSFTSLTLHCSPLMYLQWFRFNDHNVTLATKSQVLAEQAFLLFYVIQSLAWTEKPIWNGSNILCINGVSHNTIHSRSSAFIRGG